MSGLSESERTDQPPTRDATPAEPLIGLSKLGKTYRDGQVRALDQVTLDILAGQFVAITGPSGCGKSTLLNLIGALDRPTDGEIRFRGLPLRELEDLDRFRAREIGFIFQSFYLLPNLTAEENVQLPMFESPLPVSEREAEARRLLAQVGLEDRRRHLPSQLSSGQRQRVAVARALANQPSLLLADEPTGSLDSRSGAEIMQLLENLHAERSVTLLVVTHAEMIARSAERQITMLDGRIESDS